MSGVVTERAGAVARQLIPDDAPFTAEQRAWLNGFLMGALAPAGSGAGHAPARDPLWVVFGSQGGTAEGLARQLGRDAKQRGYPCEVMGMESVNAARLAEARVVLLVTSTYGDGEPPDNARALHGQLHAPDAPRLDGVRFAVCGLGDTSYEKFNQCAKEFDARLEALGGRRLHARADCEVDYEAAWAAWKQGVFGMLEAGSGAPAADSPAPVAAARGGESGHGGAVMVRAVLRESRVLNGAGSTKETRHVVFAREDGALEYAAGDALAVMPVNDARAVEQLLHAAGCDGEEAVPGADGAEQPLRLALSTYYAIGRLTAPVCRAYAERGRVAELSALCAAGNESALQRYLHGREVVDLFLEYPGAVTGAREVAGLLARLQPRLYSISSSPKAHPGEVHLTVGVVRYEAHGRRRGGVCSTYLAERLAAGGEALVRVHANARFRPPADAARDMIMVGPGTGIAPFRAFLEERRATGAPGRNWLFFGDQREASDFLYRDELETMRAEGVLTRLDVAFSRDQAEKVYVQHRMAEHGAELWRWLEGGAHFYVCGDASRMAKDVEAALLDVARAHGGRDAEGAGAWLAELRAQGRYARDVY
jgi:sulfite reductase (NADPH) flavoprotein alpha-component